MGYYDDHFVGCLTFSLEYSNIFTFKVLALTIIIICETFQKVAPYDDGPRICIFAERKNKCVNAEGGGTFNTT